MYYRVLSMHRLSMWVWLRFLTKPLWVTYPSGMRHAGAAPHYSCPFLMWVCSKCCRLPVHASSVCVHCEYKLYKLATFYNVHSLFCGQIERTLHFLLKIELVFTYFSSSNE
ncbi:hypothetical protein O6H91_Y563900 [Diphasiastrum complanatum]|nr:hypothetical protein O6H91_Y563900 [Diphasiastrum complanatum]